MGAVPALRDIGVWVWGAIINQRKLNSMIGSLWEHKVMNDEFGLLQC